MKKIVIIGAGLAGLSSAYHLEKKGYTYYKMFEMENRVGGLCKSEKTGEFIFDYTGHLLHLHTEYTKNLIFELLNKNIKKIKRSSWIYSQDVYTPYPFQVNLYGLPPGIVKECIMGFIEARYEDNKKEITSFEEWIYKYLGKGIAKYFMVPYNKKLWTVHPKEMTTEWLGGYVPNPSIEEIIDGALQPPTKDFGYNAYFYYPIKGGIEMLPRAFANNLSNKIYLNTSIIKVDLDEKIITLSDGTREKYDILISTIPLPELVNLIEDADNNIKNDSKKLRYVSVYNVNIGLKSNRIRDKHWIYFAEDDFVFYRVGFPSNFSESMSPPAYGSSIYAEISYSKEKTIDKGKMFEKVIDGLIRSGIIETESEIVTSLILDISYAYVIYDKNYRKIINSIHAYLESNNIYSIGRFGSWEYSAMEDAILEGKDTVEQIINSIGSV